MKVRSNNYKNVALCNLMEQNIRYAYEWKDMNIIDAYEAKMNEGLPKSEYFNKDSGEVYDEIYEWFYSPNNDYRNNNRPQGQRYVCSLLRCINQEVGYKDSYGDQKDANKIYMALMERDENVTVKNFFPITTGVFKNKISNKSNKNILKEVAWFVVHSYVCTYLLNCENMYKMMPVGRDFAALWNKYLDMMEDIPDVVKHYFKMDEDGTSEFQRKYAENHDLQLDQNSPYGNYMTNLRKTYRKHDHYITNADYEHKKHEEQQAKNVEEVEKICREILNRTEGMKKSGQEPSQEEVNKVASILNEVFDKVYGVNRAAKYATKNLAKEIDKRAGELKPMEFNFHFDKEKAEKRMINDLIETVREGAHDNNPAAVAVVAETILPPSDPDDKTEKVVSTDEVKEVVDPAELEHPQDDLEDAVVPETPVATDVPFDETTVKTEKAAIDDSSNEAIIDESENEHIDLSPEVYVANNQEYHKLIPDLEKFTKICNSLGYHVFYDPSTEHKGLLNAILVNNKFNTLYKRLMIDPSMVYGNGVRVITNTNRDRDLRKEMYIPVENKVLLQKVIKNTMTAEDRKAFNEKLPRCLNDFRQEYSFLDRVDLSKINARKTLTFGEWKGLIINISKVLMDKELPMCRYRVNDVNAPDSFKLICDNNVITWWNSKLMDTDSHKKACDEMFAVVYDAKKYGNDTPYVYGHVTAAA